MADRPNIVETWNQTADLSSVSDAAGTSGAGPRSNADRYELLGEIARGGMGAVFRARDKLLGREVAIKILQERFAAESGAARRFGEEARITGRLQHPGVPPVHDVGVMPDGRPFLAMKLIEGSTLDEELTRRAGPIEDRSRFLAVFEQVCQAVACAHAQGIVHRDLKPQNIMVGAFGEVQVMDWGLAKTIGSADDRRTGPGPDPAEGGSLTQAGSMVGTPAFMPPEQARGELPHIDERADVFGLGAILCVILTGRPPYTGATFEAVRQAAVRGDTADARQRLDVCEWESEIVALCRRCLSTEPAERPRDAAEVAREVGEVRSAAEERARTADLNRVRAEAETGEQRKRRRVQAALAVSLLVLAVGTGAGAFWARHQQARREADAIQQRAEEDLRRVEDEARATRNSGALDLLLSRCESSLRDSDDAAAAQTTLVDAEKRAAEGITAEQRVRLDRCRTDLAWLKELDRLDRERHQAPTRQTYGSPRHEQNVVTAFAKMGFPLDLPPAAAVERIDASLVRNQLLGSLEVWHTRSRRKPLADWLSAADPDKYRNEVRRAVAAGNAAEVQALGAREEAIRQPPRFAMILGLLPQIDINRRTQILVALCRAKPDEFRALLETAQFLSQRAWLVLQQYGTDGGHYGVALAEALGMYQAATAVRPTSDLAWMLQGAVLLSRKDYAGALHCARTAIRLRPDVGVHHALEGAVLLEHGDFAGAARSLARSIELEPEFGPTHQELGKAFESLRQPEKALASYREALRLDPNQVDSRRAIERLTGVKPTAASLEDDLKRMQGRWRGTILDKGGRAVGVVERTVAGNTETTTAKGFDGIVYDVSVFEFKLEQRAKGRVCLYSNGKHVSGPNAGKTHADGIRPYELGPDTWTEVRGGGAPTIWYRVHVAPPPREKKPVSTIEDLRAAVRLNPNSARAHFNLGFGLAKLDPAGAIDAYRESIRLDPKFPMAHNNLGVALYGRKDYAAAEPAFREAIRLQPTNPMFHNNLGTLRSVQNDYDGAIAAINEALRLDPGFTAAKQNLTRVQKAKDRVAPPPREVKK